MVATDGLYILKHRCIGVRVSDWLISYIRAIFHICGTPFQISGSISDIQKLFMRLGLAVLRKHLTGDYNEIFVRYGFLI